MSREYEQAIFDRKDQVWDMNFLMNRKTFTEADLGYRPHASWSRFPVPELVPYKLPLFDDVFAESLRLSATRRPSGDIDPKEWGPGATGMGAISRPARSTQASRWFVVRNVTKASDPASDAVAIGLPGKSDPVTASPRDTGLPRNSSAFASNPCAINRDEVRHRLDLDRGVELRGGRGDLDDLRLAFGDRGPVDAGLAQRPAQAHGPEGLRLVGASRDAKLPRLPRGADAEAHAHRLGPGGDHAELGDAVLAHLLPDDRAGPGPLGELGGAAAEAQLDALGGRPGLPVEGAEFAFAGPGEPKRPRRHLVLGGEEEGRRGHLGGDRGDPLAQDDRQVLNLNGTGNKATNIDLAWTLNGHGAAGVPPVGIDNTSTTADSGAVDQVPPVRCETCHDELAGHIGAAKTAINGTNPL